MSNSGKVLGQSRPAAGVLTDIYTVPSVSTQTIVSHIVVCNYGGAPDTFSISVAPLGAADTSAHYQIYLMPIDYPDSFMQDVKWTLNYVASGDKIRVLSTLGYCSFTVYGVEVS